jgi:hypothetical protein
MTSLYFQYAASLLTPSDQEIARASGANNTLTILQDILGGSMCGRFALGVELSGQVRDQLGVLFEAAPSVRYTADSGRRLPCQ